ncbi:NfeD family protein [Streptosporangium saharense]|uniref:Membrane protein implicated in regulation of membrane protease activity n=1 Tax=Streptosporangium saharense TaxID=1706840 RepID=A0A7W7VP78_9ACTN|nr:NfeD family protein [Streptosporangium saharense]MBB4917671.1 membrane protein implicated in regulation of membrane protease activity [Streptosporangium saharense]
MDYWVIWLILAVVLGVAEIFTLTTALGLLGGAALITSVAAGLGLPLPLQLLVFAAAMVTGMVVVRPIARRHLLPPSGDRRFGIQALVGKSAYVLTEVTGRDGRVRIGGEEWSARAYDETLVIPAGAVVDVIEIEGATALVYPRE